ncbi:MAG: DMT family transporter [Aliishimia sp.]
MNAVSHHRPLLAISFMCVGMFCVSLNDMAVKSLSGDYPLHQLVFLRSFIALAMATAFLQFEGGFAALRVANPGLHLVRAALLVMANSCFYAALVAMPIATATAIYFVAPLIVTLLAIPVLGERVGPRRIAAISVGFCGVLVILGPEIASAAGLGWIVVLPVLAASGYATMSVLTRKLGARAPASVLSFWVQVAFLMSGGMMWLVAGDGRFAQAPDVSKSADFLLRAWVWPDRGDWIWIASLGILSGIVGYVMSQAYRLAAAATVAPFEYMLMLYALFWGWMVFGEWPGQTVFVGAGIIISSGIYIVWRERGGRS